jgi:SOS-response transcriptional repressor LexA
MRVMTEDTTQGSRLRSLRQKRGYETALRFANALGMRHSTVLCHETDKRGIPPKTAKRYARFLGVAPEVIIFGNGLNQDYAKPSQLVLSPLASKVVPLLSCMDAEQFRLILCGAIPMSDESIAAPRELDAGERVFVVKMPDRSMEDGSRDSVYEGDYIYVDPDRPHAIGDLVGAIAPGVKGMVVREYREKSVGKFDLVALNPRYPSVIDAQDGAQILGRVIGTFRNR